jgi:SAM-dependent methyltransferase
MGVMMAFDRSQKNAFNDAASDYDSYRPHYPDEAIAKLVDLSELRPNSRLLEVGCGTGQATLPLAKLGYQIDAVELGHNLAAVAIKKLVQWPRVHITVGSYEEYASPEAVYDLVYSAQAFHWVDPNVRLLKTARLLRPRGCLALLYNCTPQLDGSLAILSDRLQNLTGIPVGTPQMDIDMERWRNELTESKLYSSVTLSQFPWNSTYSSEAYQGLYRTYSDFRRLSTDLRAKTAEVIARTIDEAGGTITRNYVCTLIHARRVG